MEAQLEVLEARTLLSAAAGMQPLALLPNETALSSPSFSDLWHLHNTGQTLHNPVAGPASGTANADIDAVRAWDLETGRHSVIIAILDTGMEWTHPDLSANLFTNTNEIPGNGIDDDGNGVVDDVHGWNFVDNNGDTTDSVGHGTTVAGVIGAVGNNGKGIAGVAWDVQLLPVKVGTLAGVSNAALISGINYIIGLKNEGFDIVAINASYLDFSVPGADVFSAIADAGDNGLLYIAAAGNGGLNLDTIDPIGFWGSQANVITVAATDNQDQLASFSNTSSHDVNLGAPGVDILTTGPGGSYLVVSGTSYSAPMVSGAVALLASFVPTATVAQMKNAILASVDPVPSLAGKTVTGGRLNVFDALETLIGNQAPTGAVEQANGTAISGWAFDFNAGQGAATVTLKIDDQTVATMAANESRPDLDGQLGSVNHGFTFSLGNLTLGSHKADVFVTNVPGSGQVLLGTRTFTVVAGTPKVTFSGGQIFLNQVDAVGFGAQLVGGTGPVRTVTVKNIGDQALTLAGLAVPAGFGIDDGLVATLAAGASDSFTIRMLTTSKGVKAGNVSFTWGSTNFAFGIIGEVGDSFVQNLYHDILGREADASGLAAWNGQILNGTATPVQITSAILNSTEYRTRRIGELYLTILGRGADGNGTAAWLGFFAAGGTVEQMSAEFYGSQEYFNAHGGSNAAVAGAYYIALLGRTGEQSGIDFWAGQFASGLPRKEVAFTFIKSQESRERTVRGIYVRYLGRGADAGGLAYWAGVLGGAGQSETTMIISFLSSPEYFAK